jgi:hypothetical protein
VEFAHDSRKYEVKRSQAKDCEDVRGVNNERIASNREDGRNGIDGEDNIGCFDGNQHQEKRCCVALPALDDCESRTPIVSNRRDQAFELKEERISLWMHLASMLEQELHTRENEKAPENVDDPVKALNECRAQHQAQSACAFAQHRGR